MSVRAKRLLATAHLCLTDPLRAPKMSGRSECLQIFGLKGGRSARANGAAASTWHLRDFP